MRKLFIATLTLMMASPALMAQQAGWSVQPGPTERNLYGISFSDSNIWVAVGDTGTILRTTDGGSSWNTVASPVNEQLRAVSFHDSVGVAVGLAGRVLRTTDRGLNWTEEQRPTTRGLYSVSMGDSMTVITGEEGWIFVSTDNGISWQPHTAGTASVLFGVSVYGNVGVGVGGRAAIVMSDNRGSGWGLTILGPPDQLFFYGTSFINSSTGWAVGSYTPTGSVILRSDLSGFVWNAQTTPTTDILFGVSASTIDSVTAVGANGTIIHTTNGGLDWSTQQSGVLQSLNAVRFVDPRFGIAVGDGGMILRTLTGGLVSVDDGSFSQIPDKFNLGQNYPNPFNAKTLISYSIPMAGNVTIDIYDVLGRRIESLAEGEMPAGEYHVIWDGSRQTSGIYFYRFQTEGYSDTGRMVLLK